MTESNTKRFARIGLVAALLGGVGAFASAKAFAGEDCCAQKAACCKPGASCCKTPGAHAGQ